MANLSIKRGNDDDNIIEIEDPDEVVAPAIMHKDSRTTRVVIEDGAATFINVAYALEGLNMSPNHRLLLSGKLKELLIAEGIAEPDDTLELAWSQVSVNIVIPSFKLTLSVQTEDAL
jgi:hypothetical protein